MMSPEAPTNTPMMPITTPIMRGVLLQLSLSEVRVIPVVEVYKPTTHEEHYGIQS